MAVAFRYTEVSDDCLNMLAYHQRALISHRTRQGALNPSVHVLGYLRYHEAQNSTATRCRLYFVQGLILLCCPYFCQLQSCVAVLRTIFPTLLLCCMNFCHWWMVALHIGRHDTSSSCLAFRRLSPVESSAVLATAAYPATSPISGGWKPAQTRCAAARAMSRSVYALCIVMHATKMLCATLDPCVNWEAAVSVNMFATNSSMHVTAHDIGELVGTRQLQPCEVAGTVSDLQSDHTQSHIVHTCWLKGRGLYSQHSGGQ